MTQGPRTQPLRNVELNGKPLYWLISVFFFGLSDVAFAQTSPIELSQVALESDSSGFVINGVDPSDQAGINVRHVGDVNGDGLDDVIIGTDAADPNGDGSGAAYVVFGQTGVNNIELSQLEAGSAGGFVINGTDAGDNAGYSVSGAGDVNGDGLDDLIIGANKASPNDVKSGASYVVFGKATTTIVELSQLESGGTGGFVINGFERKDFAGYSVSGAGDVNGDGLADVIVGARAADPNANGSGAGYVVFGKSTNTAIELSQLESGGTGGFVINGVDEHDGAGYSVSGAGDVNGDGLDDVVVGALLADPSGDSSGASYVVFGKSTNTAVELSQLESGGAGGFVINGSDSSDYSGANVSGAGDINGDGLHDVIIGAYQADPNGDDSGASYVVFGKTDVGVIELSQLEAGGVGGFVINGSFDADLSGFSVAGAGDINGDGLGDLIVGARMADPNGNESGAAYLVFGKADNTAIELSNFNIPNSAGYVLNGAAEDDQAGFSVSGGGDINGDGRPDILVGAYYADPNGTNSGSSYVIFGPHPDQDWDGVPDHLDAFANDPTETLDTDGDGIGNNQDTDDDGDGVADLNDAFPLNPAESTDADGDGIGDNADPDDNNNGLADIEEGNEQINQTILGMQSAQAGNEIRFKVDGEHQNPANCNNADFYVIEQTDGWDTKLSLLMSAYTGNRTLSLIVHPLECSTNDQPKVINIRYGDM